MIGKLKGTVEATGIDWALIDVGGVGYHVFCSAKTLERLPAVGAPCELHTEMLVSQDMIRLVGFAHAAEKEWFRLLQTVQGVGAKVALAILSTFTPGDLANALALQDKAMVGRAPGVGKKLAERIVLELKDKAPAFVAPDAAMAKAQGAIDAPRSSAAADAVSALVNLGYGQAQAGAAVASAIRKSGDDQPAENLIRVALRELAVS
jgi:Holliday junction DNA helicase RuvA